MIPYPQRFCKSSFLRGKKLKVICCKVRDPSEPQSKIQLQDVARYVWTTNVPLTPFAKVSQCLGKSYFHNWALTEVVQAATSPETLLTCFTLYPAFALVSMNITFSSLAFLSPSSMDTCLGKITQNQEKKREQKP